MMKQRMMPEINEKLVKFWDQDKPKEAVKLKGEDVTNV